jgi:hypothetical protein
MKFKVTHTDGIMFQEAYHSPGDVIEFEDTPDGKAAKEYFLSNYAIVLAETGDIAKAAAKKSPATKTNPSPAR